MKKFYLFSMALVALVMTSRGQSCGVSTGFAFPFSFSGGCYVYVTGALPDAQIRAYNGTTLLNVTTGSTNSSGIGQVFFTCGQTITRVLLVKGSVVCEINGANIAALASLPIKLTAFSARVTTDNAASLQWNSEFELDSYNYIVQRSTDGRNFTNIGAVAAAGNSIRRIGYDFKDIQLGTGVAYYRLKMVDIDGKSEYSKIIYVNNRKIMSPGGGLSVFPNPFRGEIQLKDVLTADVNSRNIHVYNAMGKEIRFAVTGANAITVDAGAPAGVYILRVKDQSFKLVKQD
jgi:hypothetical protein